MPGSLKLCLLWRSFSALHVHPHRFRQYIQLTDGSFTSVTSLTPEKPLVKLNADAMTHPSWNLDLRNQLLLDEGGHLSKFKNKFGELDSFDDLVDMGSTSVHKKDTPRQKEQSKGGDLIKPPIKSRKI